MTVPTPTNLTGTPTSNSILWQWEAGGVDDDDFITVWKTDNAGTSTDYQITLPVSGAYTYTCTVNWGDSNSTELNDTGTNIIAAGTNIHTYDAIGTYTVRISGSRFDWMYFNNGGDKLKILEIKNWGNIPVYRLYSSYRGCSNLDITATDTIVLSSGVANLSVYLAFDGVNSINNSINGTHSSIIDPYGTFRYVGTLTSNLSNWSLGSSGTMSMVQFFRSIGTFDQDISHFNFTSVTAFNDFMLSTTISTANYNALLVALAGQAVNTNLTFHGGGSTHSGSGTTARATLTDPTGEGGKGWTINDGGPA